MGEESENTSSSTSQQSPSHQQPGDTDSESQAPASSGFPAYPYGYGHYPMYPIPYPVLVPGMNPVQNEEQMNWGAGIYAVPVYSYMGHVACLPSNNLIPLTYSFPTTRPSNEAATGSEEQLQAGQQQQGQQQQPAHHRQVVVRRFQIAFQLDLLLILKLAAVIFLFNQDGSRQRLAVLVFLASIIYLYQTGALAPLVQWLTQGMQRAAAPPQPQRPPVRADNDPAATRPLNENAAAPAEGQGREANEGQPADNGNRAAENENVAEAEAGNRRNQWWGIVKEIQMIVFGFITSLLPGFHNIE